MAGREWGPLLGTVVCDPDVYEIREGTQHPVVVYRGDTPDPVGYVTAYELRLACEGRIPVIPMTGPDIARLSRMHIELRRVVGELVRTPDPGRVVVLGGGS